MSTKITVNGKTIEIEGSVNNVSVQGNNIIVNGNSVAGDVTEPSPRSKAISNGPGSISNRMTT